MNGKQAKALRKAMDIKKPTPHTEGQLYKDQIIGKIKRMPNSNPIMNMYRSIKRRYVRGLLRSKE